MTKLAYEAANNGILKSDPKLDANDPGFQREARWWSYGIMDTVEIWDRLNKTDPFSLLYNPGSSNVIQKIFQVSNNARDYDLFTAITFDRIPNVSELSWEKAFERWLDVNHKNYDQLRT